MTMNTDGNLAALATYQRQVDDDAAFDAAVDAEVEELMEMKLCDFLAELSGGHYRDQEALISMVAQERVISRADDVDEPDDVAWDWDGER